MHPPGTPAQEEARLARLRLYEILDTDTEQAFDDLVQVAAAICDVPISAVSLIDDQRQWFKASIGLDVRQTSRDVSFCGHAILTTGLFIVEDALVDQRFWDNPLVTGAPHIRFYAGATLVTEDGHALGTLCVIDRTPRKLTSQQQTALECLGRQCVRLLESKLLNRGLEQAARERQAALARSVAQETRLQAIAEAAMDGIVAADDRGCIISWNSAAESIFGYTRAEILGRPLTTIMPERYRMAHTRGLERLASGGESRMTGRSIDLQGCRRDGTEFALEMTLGSWISSDGRRNFSGVLRDVTSARAAALAIQNERDFSTAILDATDALILVLDRAGIITQFNSACERASGYRAPEVIGRRFDFLLPADEVTGVGDAFAHLAAGQLRGRYQNHWLHKDGSKRFITWSNAVLVDEQQQVLHVIGTGIDMTDKQNADAALGRQGAIMTSVLQNMRDGVIITDELGDFVLYNDAAAQMLGRGAGDGSPETWPTEFGMYLPDQRTRLDLEQTPLKRALRGEHVDQFEIFMRVPRNPEGRWHSVTSSPIRDTDGGIIGTISVGRDVTERKQAEEQLGAQAEMLRDLALKDELTGLHNRRGFLLLAEQQLRHAARSRRPALVVFIDLDGMKAINDQGGHEDGDRALQDAADILRAAFRESDIIARLGGDEFVALISDAETEALPRIEDRLETALRLKNAGVGRAIPLGMSVGSAAFDPFSPRPIEVLLSVADAVMYTNKRSRRATATAMRAQPV